jgi:hypothetical protein
MNTPVIPAKDGTSWRWCEVELESLDSRLRGNDASVLAEWGPDATATTLGSPLRGNHGSLAGKGRYAAVHPPSIDSIAPVIDFAASLAR